MFKVSGFSFSKLSLICLLGFSAFLFSLDTQAQEENSPRQADKPNLEENVLVLENVQTSTPLFKPSPTKQAATLSAVKKELSGTGMIQEKELKKNESPSTLSFNIFLYIVDKFKED